MGRRGAVATNHPLATQAGLLALRAGGNAVDAAVAVGLTLGVVEPNNSGLGGDGFYHVFHRPSGRAVVFNGTGFAPLAATPERYAKGIPNDGPLSVSVPGTVGGLGAMHKALGRNSWASLFDAAVHYAREGYGATHAYRRVATEKQPRLAADPRSRKVFLDDGAVPKLGAIVRQSDLARTLEELAQEGADGFYRGGLAKRVARGMADVGTLIVADDLAAFHPEEQAPIEIDYRGFTVRQCPPNSMGWVLLQELKIVETFDVAAMGVLSADFIHTLVEAKKLAFADRERHSADPRTYKAPLDRLLSKEYAEERARLIDRRQAAPFSAQAEAAGNTTYFCVVDGEGSAVSGIQSINAGFGSAVTAGDTGILLNNRMAPWHLQPGHPNRLTPHRRTRHTMNTPMVFKDGELWAVCGTPGGDNQVQINLQILSLMIDGGYDAQQAAEAPRWASTQPGQHADWPHECPDALNLESRFDPAAIEELKRRGHPVVPLGPLDGPCSVEIIRREASIGMLMAGSDPRRDGWALAY
jgi:gamma-glutamyltranspeptidase/glutathione hydrolase